MKRLWVILLASVIFPLGIAWAAPASPSAQNSSELTEKFLQWNAPAAPFRVAGNIYFVGMQNISSFLIIGNQGHILIDTGFSNSVPIIVSNILRLGFSPRDIRYILSSHAHCDHVAGHAAMRRLTGARIGISIADAPLLRSGGRRDFLFGRSSVMHFEKAEPNFLIKEGDEIRLGGIHLTAHLTPGHTPGCTTWSTEVEEGGRRLNVLFFGSTSINPGTKFVGNREYPSILDDLRSTYAKLRTLPCDIFLAPHPEQFHLHEKLQRPASGVNPFVDPSELKTYLDAAEAGFKQELQRQSPAPNPRG